MTRDDIYPDQDQNEFYINDLKIAEINQQMDEKLQSENE